MGKRKIGGSVKTSEYRRQRAGRRGLWLTEQTRVAGVVLEACPRVAGAGERLAARGSAGAANEGGKPADQ